MALIGRLHPLLVHFPIGLVLVAAAAEVFATTFGWSGWRDAAIANVRVSAALSIGAAVAGWRLASAPGVEATSALEWHRWMGVITVLAVCAAALASAAARNRSPFGVWVYRIALLWAAILVAVTGHLGGVLVWGADFLRP